MSFLAQTEIRPILFEFYIYRPFNFLKAPVFCIRSEGGESHQGFYNHNMHIYRTWHPFSCPLCFSLRYLLNIQ